MKQVLLSILLMLMPMLASADAVEIENQTFGDSKRFF